MNDRYKYRLLVALVLGLALLNIALLFWFGPFSHGRREGRHASERVPFLTRQLGFTDDQRQQYNTLRKSYFAERRALAETIRPLRRRFFSQLGDTTQSNSALLVQARTYHDQLAQIDVLTLRHFQQVASICTPAQREKLAQIVRTLPQAATRNNRNPGPRHGRENNF